MPIKIGVALSGTVVGHGLAMIVYLRIGGNHNILST
jgi:hypothetical protein